MKMNIKKVATIVGSALMIGATAGMAAAAAYPAPFVSNGAANVAIVVGGNAALSDGLAASAIAADLATDLAAQTATGATTSGSAVSGGDSYKLEKSSTKFNLGDSAVEDVVSASVTDSNLPILLADGVYMDDDNDEFDYAQTVTLGNNFNVTMFEDNDYKSKVPTVGIKIPNGAHILNYTLDFADQPEWADLATTDLPILGKEYYVLSNSSAVGTSLTLLDSASTVVVTEGETSTIAVGDKSYEVSVSYLGTDSVKLVVNGETTNTLNEGETQKLSDKSFIGVKDILYSAKDTGISKVEISIGKGKLLITDGADVELNDESITGLTGDIQNSSTKLDKIVLQWNADDDQFITADTSITMPGFEVIKASFGGLNYPDEEKIVIENDGDDSIVLSDFPLKDSTEDINLLYYNTTNYSVIGADADNVLRTGTTSISFDGDTDEWFVASWNDTEDSESYLLKAADWKNESGTQKVSIYQRKNGAWTSNPIKTDAQNGETVTIGSVEFTIGSPVKADKTVTLTAVGNTNFNTLYSKEGMRVNLPWINTTAGNLAANYSTNALACAAITASGVGQLGFNQAITYNLTSAAGNVTATCVSLPETYTLNLTEENKDGTLGAGNKIVITLADDSSNDVAISSVDMGTTEGAFTEQGDTDVFRNFAYSELATEAIWDKSGDQDMPITLTYHGSEVIADVFITSPSATVSAGSGSANGATQLGAITVKDSEVSSMSGKNLIVIGGSCVNSVAADLLGGAACDAAFTAKSGVKAGEALIKSFARGDKIALLVAGYNAEDTTKAATYLTMKGANTTVGAALKVTSATEATAITA